MPKYGGVVFTPEERTRLRFMLEVSDQDSWSGGARVTALAEMANQMTSTDETALALKSLLTAAMACWWGNPTQETRDLSWSPRWNASRSRTTTLPGSRCSPAPIRCSGAHRSSSASRR